MNAVCFICAQATAMQCQDCGGFSCSEHGEPPYCMYCALKHDEPLSLRHALSAIPKALSNDRGALGKLVNDLYGNPIMGEKILPSYPGLIAGKPEIVERFLREFDKWVATLKLRGTPFGQLFEDDKRQVERWWVARAKTQERLLALLNEDDHTTRFRTVYVLRNQPDKIVLNALTRVVEHDRNIWVREAATKVLWGLHKEWGSDLPEETIYRALREDKLYYWANVCLLEDSDRRRAKYEKAMREKEEPPEKYAHLRLAIDITLGKSAEHRELKDLGLEYGEESAWAKNLLASTIETELIECLRARYKKTEGPFSLRWDKVKGSIFEEPWRKAGLPTSREEEEKDWGRPRKVSYEGYDDPIYWMNDYV